MSVKYNQTRRLKGFAVGTIIPWAGDLSAIPPGWLACTGGTKQALDYPQLYAMLGNTYGGTVGSTFGLPALINGRGIQDTYRGHYAFLKTLSPNMHWYGDETETNISANPYWNQIQDNTNSTNSYTGQSQIDVVGAFINPSSKPNLVGTVTGITFEKGSIQVNYSIHPRRLGENHNSISAHNHGLNAGLGDQEPPNSFTASSGSTSNCGNKDSTCKAANTGCHQPITMGIRHVLSSHGGSGTFVKGGSTANSQSTSMQNNGDGQVSNSGNTYAKSQGHANKFYATSMSNADTQSWSSITGHQHTYGGATFKCNVGSQTSYTFYDINSSAVNIINTSGENAGSINISTLTPSLTMVYIIKAY